MKRVTHYKVFCFVLFFTLCTISAAETHLNDMS